MDHLAGADEGNEYAIRPYVIMHNTPVIIPNLERSPMNITITEHLNPPVTIFNIEGRIHLGNAAQLREKAQEAYDSGARNLILDLSGVQSLTSEGLRSIHVIQIYLKVNPLNRGIGW